MVVAVCSIHDEEPIEILAARYKPVDKKVRPVAAPAPAELQLHGVDVEWTSGKRLTDERLEAMQVGDGLLSDVEVEYFKQMLHEVDGAFAFQDSEMGLLKVSVEPPIRVPMIPHTPWSHAPYPVPRALHGQVVELLKAKMTAGVIEPSIGGRCITDDAHNDNAIHIPTRIHRPAIRSGSSPNPVESDPLGTLQRNYRECCPDSARRELEEKYGELSTLPAIETLVEAIVRRFRRHEALQLTEPVAIKSSREFELETAIEA
ncbi:MAG: hypothetical protein J3R72DRAFT_511441 [Linnemannia gamsii]|nr:MAG: hypothetical protein J3R72DRAFT_511441 [Linnemannia gamsii]